MNPEQAHDEKARFDNFNLNKRNQEESDKLLRAIWTPADIRKNKKCDKFANNF